MRVVADTNILISGLLWRGSPHRVLQAAEGGLIRLFSSVPLLEELEAVLRRDKFSSKLKDRGEDPQTAMARIRGGVFLVSPAKIEPVVIVDPDDDAVLACAVAASAEAVVSGDPHLLALKQYAGIPILTAIDLLLALDRRPTRSDRL